jgi:NADH:ubiquinone oxidoreductase subunit 3 (subunit A)
MTTILIIAAIWLAAAIFVAVIFHFCLSPRRFEKHRAMYPFPSGSMPVKPENGAV